MKLTSRAVAAVVVLTLPQLFSHLSIAADWPTWRHDSGRSGVTDEQLPAEMYLQWSRKLPPLKPAWPEDVRLQFDADYQPIVVGKLMYIASSHNDSVTAYDTDTGEKRWRFFADAPVRFAPVASNGTIYFGADDGCLYCLDGNTGALVSKLNATPSIRTAIGNERLISIWPVRGGPVIIEDSVYFTIGVWPFEGTYLVKSNLKDIAASAPLTPLDNFSPQGYLASNGNKLVIPGGRANAICRDLKTGKSVSLRYSSKGLTDHHVIAHEQWMFHGGKAVSLDTGALLKFVVDRPLISDGKIYISAKGKAGAYDIKNPQLVEKKDRKGKITKIEVPTLLWQFDKQPVTKVHVKTAKRVYAHHGNTIFAIDDPVADEKPKVSFSAVIEGTCSSMLAADGKLFVVTKEGEVYCFGPTLVAPKEHKEDKKQLATDSAWAKKASDILKQTNISDGYCLSLGIGTGHLIEELVRQSQLTIIAVDPDAKNVDAFRRRLDAKGLYGTRVVVLQGTADNLGVPLYLASLVVSEDIKAVKFGSNNLGHTFRAMRPYGGVACFELTPEQHNDFSKMVGASSLANAVVARSGSWTTLTREGALPGSADWTHEYGDPSNTLMSREKLVKAPMGALWFGGPSSHGKLYYDRHQWAPSLAVIEGRMFLQGPGVLTAVDVYTGRILWQNKIPSGVSPGRRANWGPSGFHFVALKDALYLTYPDKCLVLDPKTGKQAGEFRLPEEADRWGRIRVVEELIITPVFQSVKKSGDLPVKLIGMDRHTGKIVWTKTAEQSFAMVAIGNGTVYCVDGILDGLYRGADKKRRQGNPSSKQVVHIRAFAANSGADVWMRATTRAPSWLAYSEKHDVLVTTNRSGIDAWYGISGDKLWSKEAVGRGFRGHPENYYGRVILWHDQVIDQRGPGAAYNIKTGETIKRSHPITGKQVDWNFTKSGHHCGYAIASEHLLTFRAADAGFCDLESGTTGRFKGFRSGCRNSLIPANGVLNAPNFAFGCKCSYSVFTSLALVHVPESDLWTYSALKAGEGVVRKLGINFGGRGDRTAENGTPWMDYPNVGGSSPSISVKLETDKPKWFRLPSTQVSGDGLKWVAASGVSGVTSITVPLVMGKSTKKLVERTYTVRLSFVEPNDAKAGQRTFDVSIQGKVAIRDMDVVSEAGGARRILVKEFRGIKADRDVTIAFTPKTGQALVSGVEVVIEAK
jgi:outer membrane protein assembly factor BamB